MCLDMMRQKIILSNLTAPGFLSLRELLDRVDWGRSHLMVKQNLVIVESPTKAKTIERYLGKT